ncbi:hypothetical protein AKO1_007445 [Acrasis kona]|uniref:Uncharacterized protein n=1 Tax=Acrasis kona TaxID=1008807 RepID=A0AAW2YRX0_9EUKA
MMYLNESQLVSLGLLDGDANLDVNIKTTIQGQQFAMDVEINHVEENVYPLITVGQKYLLCKLYKMAMYEHFLLNGNFDKIVTLRVCVNNRSNKRFHTRLPCEATGLELKRSCIMVPIVWSYFLSVQDCGVIYVLSESVFHPVKMTCDHKSSSLICSVKSTKEEE